MAPLSPVLFLSTISFIAGVVVAKNFGIDVKVVFLLFSFSYLIALLSRKGLFYLGIGLSFFSLGLLRYMDQKVELRLLRYLLKEAQILKGPIISIPQGRGENLYFDLRLESVDGKEMPYPLKVRISVDKDLDLEPGDIVQVNGKLKGFKGKVSFYATSFRKIGVNFSFKRYLYRLKRKISKFISDTYPKTYACFVKAIILGEFERGLKDLRYIFRKTGLAHILAISGLHVGLLISFSYLLLKSLGIYGHKRSIFLFFILLSYTLITGARPPVLRATLMATVYIYLWFFYKRPNPFNLLLFSALLILLYDPKVLFYPSFQLSFLALLGIFSFLYLFPPSAGGLKAKISSYSKVVLGSWLFVSPLIWYHWGYISFLGLPSNFIAVPLFTLILASSFMASLVSLLNLELAKFFAISSYPLLYLLFKFSLGLSKLPLHYKFSKPPLSLLFFLYLLLTISILSLRAIILKRR